ncbi:MAG: hypothetical protein GY846_24955, partial [Deltaproteobacteria bacterium]|nr:hypothetical protein [Deltaproteobacteria bacterium]
EGGEPLPWWSFTDERKKKCGALQPPPMAALEAKSDLIISGDRQCYGQL